MTLRLLVVAVAFGVACGTETRPAPSVTREDARAVVVVAADAAAAPSAADAAPGLADATFAAWLTRDDWAPLIDPAIGFVSLTGHQHDVGIKRWCGPRGAMYARFEALDLAAEMTADPRATPRCAEIAGSIIECRQPDAGDRGHAFRFARRANGFVLIGIASADAAIAPADQQRYDAELAGSGHCGK